jgi:pimeloyl-ACP methyl ester carboxylesterase
MYQANIPAFRLDFNSPRPTLNCEDMQNIAAPALVLAGAERVAQCLKGRSLAKIPQGTHHSQLNHSQEFNDTVLAFLAKH